MSDNFEKWEDETLKKDDAIVELDRNTIGGEGLNDDFTQGAEGNQPEGSFKDRDTSKINDTAPHKWTGSNQNF